ncbi:hypothetical protein KHS38_05525 [Mucilaginibacter sp. Bleaf8]|uniref:asparagine synthase-related protein n=1 Tax=Mucilaginibacter sp. Bleaf8 TaxID=2834430 RepID=UPI001BCBE5ED|nr:asparagine synthase-related protein [Mucilaginibacter sp. Bleaf8]MBS7563857.1 hypothetical protein [Mucilaginibacter sp. Bleaf8]
MSVIFGKGNFCNRPLDSTDLQLMEGQLNHWRPDRTATWVEGAVGLGHLMLHNTPQSVSEQMPFQDPNLQLTITADVRLDNRNELLRKLNIQETEKPLIPDSALILQAYHKYGKQCIKHLIGDFAFVIYDAAEQQLFCGRDHLGVKPFFYYQSAEYFAFASEKKGILALPDVNRTINKQYLFNHVVFPAEQAVDDTIYQHIKKLKPAHFLVINLKNKTSQLERYWEPDVDTELTFARKEEYYEGLRYHFEQAVQCRLSSAYKVGVQLSGGLDSSAITGVAQTFLKLQNQSIVPFSNTLGNEVTDSRQTRLDERRYIDSVIEHWRIDNPVYITQHVFPTELEELMFADEVNDGPERWSSNWLLSLYAAAKQQDVRTILSGFPGDELVTYRGKYYFLDYLDKKQYLKYLWAEKKYPGFSKIEPLLPASLRHLASKIKNRLNIQPAKVHRGFKTYNYPEHYKQHLRDCIWQDPYHQEQFKSYRHFQRYRILKPQVIHRLESESRYGIYFRTETRFPMADIRLIQYYLSMPNELKYEGEQSRTAFKKAVAPYLPDMILQRDDKFGSVIPFLSSRLRLTRQEIKSLIEQLPDLKILKKEAYFKNMNSPFSPENNRKYPIPYPDVMIWMIKNKNWLQDL